MKKLLFITLFLVLAGLNANAFTGRDSIILGNKVIETEILSVDAETSDEADESIKEYITDRYSIISDKWLERIISTRSAKISSISDSSGKTENIFIGASYQVPESFLVDTAKILWELNIPEFKSRLYSLHKSDTIYIDTWNNVIGTSKDKTYAGNFEGYRVRNYPSWKDPEKPESVATPPGPKNPLGLFVVHYDENSLRYFHGTNKPNLIYSPNRSLSHGCVRNDNNNIAKMKDFLIKRVIKSADLSSWMSSKKSLSYDFKKIDRFPVRIIYRTFTVFDEGDGAFLEFYKDIYNYRKGNYSSKYNNPDNVILSTKENIISEYRKYIKGGLSDEKLSKIVDYAIDHLDFYERYYFKDLEKLVE